MILRKTASGVSELSSNAFLSLTEMRPLQRDFIEFALSHEVLKFGEFTLKSGRTSPYFFNLGAVDTGSGLAALGRFYAEAYGMTVLTTRMFTHTGPRRGDVFAERRQTKRRHISVGEERVAIGVAVVARDRAAVAHAQRRVSGVNA